jgi:hypothetical protein
MTVLRRNSRRSPASAIYNPPFWEVRKKSAESDKDELTKEPA